MIRTLAAHRGLGLLTALLPPFACTEDTTLHRDCEPTCYSGPTGTYGVGACAPGRSVCDDRGDLLACEGDVLPARETCNGIDDDCDGTIDDGATGAPLGESCGPPRLGSCMPGVIVCDDGATLCVGAIEPVTEICNGLDDDCNGVVDDIAFAGFCYNGPLGTLRHDPCRPGFFDCQSGRLVCMSQRLPDVEVCNAVDDDCDGETDEDVQIQPDAMIDVVLLVDRSGSMRAVREKVIQSLASLEARYGNDERYRFAFVSVPGVYDPRSTIESDLGPASDLTARFAVLADDRGAREPTWDAPYDVAVGYLPLMWRPGSTRLQVLFTDERGQSYRTPPLDEQYVAGMLARSRHRFFAFTARHYWIDFDDIARTTGGQMFELGDGSSVFEDFVRLLERCAPWGTN